MSHCDEWDDNIIKLRVNNNKTHMIGYHFYCNFVSSQRRYVHYTFVLVLQMYM